VRFFLRIWRRAKGAFDAAGVFGTLWTFANFVGVAIVPRFIATSDTFRAIFYVFGALGAILAFLFTGFNYAVAPRRKRARGVITFVVIALVSFGAIQATNTLLDAGLTEEGSARFVRMHNFLLDFWRLTDSSFGLFAFGLMYGLVASVVAITARAK
jgi:hypothetical protein